MDNKDFSQNGRDDDFDKYIAEEILNYYGEDFVNSVGSPPSPPPDTPKKRRRKKLYAVLSAVCAVVFLTGVVMLAGSVFSGSLSSHDTQSDGNGSLTESYIDSPILASSKQENELTSSEQTSTEIGSIPAFSKADSKAESKSPVSSKTDSKAESKNPSSKTSSKEESKYVPSKTDSKAESGYVSSNTSSTEESKSESFSVSSKSENENSNSFAQGTLDTASVASRDRDYSLPSIMSDAAVASVHTDYDNNSVTNPNESVITGKPLRAGIGVSLMIMSLAVSLVLNKLREAAEE